MLRLGQPSDAADVRALVREFAHEETPGLPACEDKLTELVPACIHDGGVIVSCTDEGDIVGTIGLVVDCPFWSDTRWMIALWHYVLPDHRREPHMRAMIRAALGAAQSQHMAFRIETWGSGSHNEGKRFIFEREIGRAAGSLFFTKAQ